MDGEEVVRRVQKTGGGTFAVSLPKEWAARQGVKAGSSAFIWENSDGSLTLRARPSVERRKCVVETGTDLENSLRKVVSAYVSGADSIVVKGGLAAAVCDEARARLSALETMEESGDEVTLQVFEKGGGFATDAVLRRMHVVVLAMFGLARGLFERGGKVMEEAEKREKEVDRLYFLVLRSAAKERSAVHDALNKTLAAKALEDLADNLEEACGEGLLVAPNSKLRRLLERAEEAYRNCFEVLYLGRYSEKGFASVEEYEKLLGKESEELMRTAKRADKAVALKGVLERLFDIAEYSKDLLEIGSDLLEFRAGAPEESAPLKRSGFDAHDDRQTAKG